MPGTTSRWERRRDSVICADYLRARYIKIAGDAIEEFSMIKRYGEDDNVGTVVIDAEVSDQDLEPSSMEWAHLTRSQQMGWP